jgi:two-component system chemotaxis sensor kinase CheA
MEPPEEEFVQEARSNLRGLTNGLLAVEDRQDPETIDELFRTAHSLKGACRTVGLADASQLAHSLEDLLDAFRRGEVEPTAELIDGALDAVDDLEATIEAATNGTGPDVDPVTTGEALRDALDAHRTDPGPSAGAAEPTSPAGAGTSEAREPDAAAAVDDSGPEADREGTPENIPEAVAPPSGSNHGGTDTPERDDRGTASSEREDTGTAPDDRTTSDTGEVEVTDGTGETNRTDDAGSYVRRVRSWLRSVIGRLS